VKGAPTHSVEITELARTAERRSDGPGPIIGHGRAATRINSPGAVAHLVRVRVDRDTGEVVPTAYVAVQDVGFALNPLLVEGQIHGGVGQGGGIGLHEEMLHDAEGQLLTASLLDYAIPAIENLPEVEAVLIANPSPDGPYGARCAGEPPIIAPAAALANAVADAVGARVTHLPITPETLWEAIG